MFALLALIVFVLTTFGVHLGSLNMIALGLSLLAAHFVLPVVTPLVPRFNQNR